MADIGSAKEIIQRAILGIPKGMKVSSSISIAFSVEILTRNENIMSEEHKTKNLFDIMLHVE